MRGIRLVCDPVRMGLIPVICCGALMLVATMQVTVAGPEKPAPVVLDATAKGVVKQEVRHSMIGPRDTLQFYKFPDQKVVVVLRIGNEGTRFPIIGKVHVFEPAVAADGLDKWINNQHSDGLFMDVPKPVSTLELPAKGFKVVKREKGRRVGHGDRVFDDYTVTFQFVGLEKDGVVLKPFTGVAKVFALE